MLLGCSWRWQKCANYDAGATYIIGRKIKFNYDEEHTLLRYHTMIKLLSYVKKLKKAACLRWLNKNCQWKKIEVQILHNEYNEKFDKQTERLFAVEDENVALFTRCQTPDETISALTRAWLLQDLYARKISSPNCMWALQYNNSLLSHPAWTWCIKNSHHVTRWGANCTITQLIEELKLKDDLTTDNKKISILNVKLCTQEGGHQ